MTGLWPCGEQALARAGASAALPRSASAVVQACGYMGQAARASRLSEGDHIALLQGARYGDWLATKLHKAAISFDIWAADSYDWPNVFCQQFKVGAPSRLGSHLRLRVVGAV